ncbi:hypothetical protein WJR50_06155 [Catalinimonas sp. 4WD22]|uniref:hypothetical protein n=1 Tax=Catalinimonas locisalis TaxID=3133978 RepID=UPI003100BB40
MMRYNFYAPVTIKRWQPLNWNDFQGFAKPFSKWGAAISSNVYLEFDTVDQLYIAYAGQNNQYSWVKTSSVNSNSSDYMLNHEQYHFNVTELHARMLNRYLVENPNEAEERYLTKLADIRAQLNQMQDNYDNASDHGSTVHMQRRWEYQIDSLLKVYSEEPNKITDYYSGANIFFPFKMHLLVQVNNEGASRTFGSEKYGMAFSLESAQYDFIEAKNLNEDLYQHYVNDSIEILSFEKDTSKFDFEASTVVRDSDQKFTIQHLWVYQDQYLYKVSAAYPFADETAGYEEIARSFLNSFEIVNTDAYWINRLKQSDASGIAHEIMNGNSNYEQEIEQCATYAEERPYSFYRGPFFSEDGQLILAMDIIEHEDSLVYESGIIVDDQWYAFSPDTTDQILFIPTERVPKEPFHLDFGYFLSEDTTKECLEFHYQTLRVNPPKIK